MKIDILDTGLLVKDASTNIDALTFANASGLLPLRRAVKAEPGYWRKVPGQWGYRVHKVGAGGTLNGAFQGVLIEYDTGAVVAEWATRQPGGYSENMPGNIDAEAWENALRAAVGELNA